MQIIRGLHNIRSEHQGLAVTIGNFDGFHLGHQAIIAELEKSADEHACQTMVMLFEPQPREFFQGDAAPARLSRFREKCQLLEDAGVDTILVIPFNAQFAAMSADAFVEELLVKQLKVKYLLVGDDFRFGHKRQGDTPLLMSAGHKHGFELQHTPSILLDGERVSSTRVRQSLVDADFRQTQKLLGRPYQMMGRVIKGEQLGRTIDVPTANILVNRRVSPLQGIYCVTVDGIKPQSMPGVASIGTRPTVNGKRFLLEVFLFNFNGDLYGRHCRVNFHKKLRDEIKYDNFTLLHQQILRDIEQATQYFKENNYE